MSEVVSDKMNVQVLVRLIMSGMYPIHTKKGGWLYFINEKGEYIGTCKDDDFKKYWKQQMYFLGEGQMTDEDKEACKTVDYLLTDEYMNHFEQWKAKVSGEINFNTNAPQSNQ